MPVKVSFKTMGEEYDNSVYNDDNDDESSCLLPLQDSSSSSRNNKDNNNKDGSKKKTARYKDANQDSTDGGLFMMERDEISDFFSLSVTPHHSADDDDDDEDDPIIVATTSSPPPGGHSNSTMQRTISPPPPLTNTHHKNSLNNTAATVSTSNHQNQKMKSSKLFSGKRLKSVFHFSSTNKNNNSGNKKNRHHAKLLHMEDGGEDGGGDPKKKKKKNKQQKAQRAAGILPPSATTSDRYAVAVTDDCVDGDNDSNDDDDSNDSCVTDHDPVMALFQRQTTQRVRFSLDPYPPGGDGEQGTNTTSVEATVSDARSGSPSMDSSTNGHQPTMKNTSSGGSGNNKSSSGRQNASATGNGSAARSIKNFMKGALFGVGGGAASDGNRKAPVAVDDDDSNNAREESAPAENTTEGQNGGSRAVAGTVVDYEAEAVKELKRHNQGFHQEQQPPPPQSLQDEEQEIVWETSIHNASDGDVVGAEVIRTRSNNKKGAMSSSVLKQISSPTRQGTIGGDDPDLTISFTENLAIRAAVTKLLNKARRAQFVHYRYEYAVKCYMKALDLLLKQGQYPDDHPTVTKTMQALNSAQYSLSSYKNSANIVKMGIRYEDTGEYIRALKMYTIAYRIRRDNLSKQHPSLMVLLNMLGSIQMKRGELDEAIQIFELALKDAPSKQGREADGDGHGSQSNTSDQHHQRYFQGNLLARSVTYREMGTIYEQWGSTDQALAMYHHSLDCVSEYKGLMLARKNDEDNKTKAAQTKALVAKPKSLDSNSLKHDADEDVEVPMDGTIDGHRDELDTIATNSNITTTSNRMHTDTASINDLSHKEILLDLENVMLSKSFATRMDDNFDADPNFLYSDDDEDGYNNHNRHLQTQPPSEHCGMELFLASGQNEFRGDRQVNDKQDSYLKAASMYDGFFPPHLEEEMQFNASPSDSVGNKIVFEDGVAQKKKKRKDQKGGKSSKNANAGKPGSGASDYADTDVALTLHQIAQLHRAQGDYNLALAAYTTSLRGMKYTLGKEHPNVAAILGNIGNLQKEMGDMDAAFATYQQVLGIESYRLGLSHPDVAITLHNIATIDAARGNHEHALALYRQVLSLQKKLFGEDHVSVAVTSACMGDVYERVGQLKHATDCFDDALRIKSIALGRHSLEVARLLHKLGKLSVVRGDYHLADSYISRAVLIYRLNKLEDSDEWVVDAYRDAADIDAAIALGRGIKFDC